MLHPRRLRAAKLPPIRVPGRISRGDLSGLPTESLEIVGMRALEIACMQGAVDVTDCAFCWIPKRIGTMKAREPGFYADEIFMPDSLEPLGLRLVRTKTLARKGDRRDFRYERASVHIGVPRLHSPRELDMAASIGRRGNAADLPHPLREHALTQNRALLANHRCVWDTLATMTEIHGKKPGTSSGISLQSESDSRDLSAAAGASELAGTDDDYFSERISSVFSSHARAGNWEAPDHVDAFSVFGDVKLDFSRASLPPTGIVEITASAIFGSVHIVIPDGAEVEVEGTPIFGSIEHKVRGKGAGTRLRELITGEDSNVELDDDGDPPLFRVIGSAVFGSIEIISG
jgi:hypothetical protein